MPPDDEKNIEKQRRVYGSHENVLSGM